MAARYDIISAGENLVTVAASSGSFGCGHIGVAHKETRENQS
jgi:hypothetical protein